MFHVRRPEKMISDPLTHDRTALAVSCLPRRPVAREVCVSDVPAIFYPFVNVAPDLIKSPLVRSVIANRESLASFFRHRVGDVLPLVVVRSVVRTVGRRSGKVEHLDLIT